MRSDTYLPRALSAIRKAKLQLLEAYDNTEITTADFEEIKKDLSDLKNKLEAALDRYNGEA